jgi:hypothetical protein
MTNAVAAKASYEIQGRYFGEGGTVTPDTHFHHSDCDSMIDHQKAWYEEAKKNGHKSGEIDEIQTILSNYKRPLTNEQLLAIINDGTLMDTPFKELFPSKIDGFIKELLETEYRDLDEYVLFHGDEKDCLAELDRMKSIQQEIAQITFHGS